jgi:hypothetical protein
MRLMSRGYSIRYVDKRQMLYNRRGYRVDEVLLTEAVVQKYPGRVCSGIVVLGLNDKDSRGARTL